MDEDRDFFGVEEAPVSASADAFEVWPENIRIVNVFLSVDTQWRVIAGLGGMVYQGLEMRSVQSALEMTLVKRGDWPTFFAGIRVMELAALPVLNSKE